MEISLVLINIKLMCSISVSAYSRIQALAIVTYIHLHSFKTPVNIKPFFVSTNPVYKLQKSLLCDFCPHVENSK